MFLDIKLEQKQGMSCDESVLASVAIWFKRRYEMLFTFDWNFRFTKPDSPRDAGLIAPRIVVDKKNPYELIEQYHGIKTTWRHLSHHPKIFKIADRELKLGNLISITFDYQFLASIPEKKRTGQFRDFPMIILGIDQANQRVYCLDIHFLKKVVFIPFANFCKGYHTYTTYEVSREVQKINWPEILEYNTTRLIENDAFNGFRKLALLIRDSLDFETENKLKDINGDPLIGDKIKTIYNSRFLFSHTLAYLSEFQNGEALNEFRQEFEKLSLEWFSAWGILAMALRQRKLNVERDFELKMQRVSQKIYAIADQEEALCQQIRQFLAGNHQAAPKTILLETPAPAPHPIQNFWFLDISNYVNNEGFATDADPQPTANFTGAGHFFLTTGLPSAEIWSAQGMKFNFPTPVNGKKDNVTCLGQTITIPKDYYTALMILGCADWGHQSEMINVFYTDGTSVGLALEFPNWAYHRSFSREILVWEGRCAEIVKGKVAPITLYQGHLFGLMIPLEHNLELERIQLPICSNLHLFAITLGK